MKSDEDASLLPYWFGLLACGLVVIGWGLLLLCLVGSGVGAVGAALFSMCGFFVVVLALGGIAYAGINLWRGRGDRELLQLGCLFNVAAILGIIVPILMASLVVSIRG